MTHIVFIEASLTGAGAKSIEYALSKDYKVSLFANDPKSYEIPFKELINSIHIVHSNTNNLFSLLSDVLEYQQIYPINGCTTTADFYVPQACLIAEQLNLPTLSYRAAITARNKYITRLAFEKFYPTVNPLFLSVDNEEDALLAIKNKFHKYPIIAKPKNGNDSNGVKLIKNENDLITYFNQEIPKEISGHKVEAGILLEEYLDGQEYSVETAQMKGGPIQLLGVTRKVDFPADNYTEISAIFPDRSAEALQVASEVQKALNVIGIDCGVLHTECKLTSKGAVKILEINPRLAGDMVGSHCIEYGIGINACGLLVEIALGNKIDITPQFYKGSAMVGIFAKKQGRLVGLDKTPIHAVLSSHLYDAIVWAKEGQTVREPHSNADLLGRIVVQADTTEEALKLGKIASENVNIEIDSSITQPRP